MDEDEYESDEPMDAAGEQSEVCFDLWISAQHHCVALQAAEHHSASPSFCITIPVNFGSYRRAVVFRMRLIYSLGGLRVGF
jgi:hypothetical protein